MYGRTQSVSRCGKSGSRVIQVLPQQVRHEPLRDRAGPSKCAPSPRSQPGTRVALAASSSRHVPELRSALKNPHCCHQSYLQQGMMIDAA